MKNEIKMENELPEKYVIKEVDDFEMDDYINWRKICDDFGLDSGDLPPDDFYKLHEIFERFIISNINENQFRR